MISAVAWQESMEAFHYGLPAKLPDRLQPAHGKPLLTSTPWSDLYTDTSCSVCLRKRNVPESQGRLQSIKNRGCDHRVHYRCQL